MIHNIKRTLSLLGLIQELSKRVVEASESEDWELVDTNIQNREQALAELSNINIHELDSETIEKLKVELTQIKEQDTILKHALDAKSKNLEGEILQTRKMGKAAKNYQG